MTDTRANQIVSTRDREPATGLMLYRLFKWGIINPVYYSYFRGRVHGVEHVPRKGRILVVSNHASDLDPLLVACSVDRPVAFMAKEELFKIPAVGRFIKLYGAYPVKRGKGDRAALKAAMNAVQQGWATGIFLDGTRTADGRIHDPKIGAAWLAAQTQATLVPVSLWGADAIFRPGKLPKSTPLTIRIGPPIAPPSSTDRAELEATTAICAAQINAMLDLGR
jgi:1-acyl-sn-glycerol-3-phosphate acyltransferase